jgi:hypothetical protein
MKTTIASTAAIAAVLLATPVLAASPEVEIRHAVARVVVIVEDRSDVAVEVDQGRSNLPALQVTRRGDEIRVEGGLDRRNNGRARRGDGIQSCRSGPANARQPGDGASVEVRDLGRINVSDAPLIIIRSPRDVKVSAGGAVYGAVGRGANSVSVGNAGCGDWVVANVNGRLDIDSAGSGDMRAGTSRTLDIDSAGSGSVWAGATGELDVAGSGDVMVTSVNGPVSIASAGSGDVVIRGGTASRLSVNGAGSGDVRFSGRAGDLQVALAGSGDVSVGAVTGRVSRAIVGSGDVHIGR